MNNAKEKRPLKYFLISTITLVALIYIVIVFPPTYKFLVSRSLGEVGSIYNLFLFLVFIFLFSFATYIFKNKTQGVLIGFFVLSFFIFRLNNLTHPFFFILLVALFLTLELLFTYRK